MHCLIVSGYYFLAYLHVTDKQTENCKVLGRGTLEGFWTV